MTHYRVSMEIQQHGEQNCSEMADRNKKVVAALTAVENRTRMINW